MNNKTFNMNMKTWNNDLFRTCIEEFAKLNVNPILVSELCNEITTHLEQENRLLNAVIFAVRTKKLSRWDIFMMDKIIRGENEQVQIDQ